jgi:hypothetical protein
MELNDPPYEFAPADNAKFAEELVVTALQLEQGALLMLTLNPLAVVDPHELMLLAVLLRLHAYAPT